MKIRPATLADAAALAAIYGHNVLHGFGTFEEIVPPTEEMGRRLSGRTPLTLSRRRARNRREAP